MSLVIFFCFLIEPAITKCFVVNSVVNLTTFIDNLFYIYLHLPAIWSTIMFPYNFSRIIYSIKTWCNISIQNDLPLKSAFRSFRALNKQKMCIFLPNHHNFEDFKNFWPRLTKMANSLLKFPTSRCWSFWSRTEPQNFIIKYYLTNNREFIEKKTIYGSRRGIFFQVIYISVLQAVLGTITAQSPKVLPVL